MALIKQLRVNIPFAKAIAQMPKCAKFLKEVKLNEVCSSIVLKKLPPKLKDLGSFIIPYTIRNEEKEELLRLMEDMLLKDNKEAFVWTIHNIKGINPTI
ncbi:hypothetical protein CR513_39960, partial [Mucuna pruriens]